MLAGRPHEAAGNGSPRWMTAGPPSGGCTEPGLQADSPAAHRPYPAPARSPGAPVPSLFRQGTRESVIDGAAAEVLRVREQVPVGVHRLGDRRVAEPRPARSPGCYPGAPRLFSAGSPITSEKVCCLLITNQLSSPWACCQWSLSGRRSNSCCAPAGTGRSSHSGTWSCHPDRCL
jgi:hypothetical protein